MMHQTIRRRWYQFNLRTMFVLVTLACVGFGWWVHSTKEWIRRRHQALETINCYWSVKPQWAPGGLWMFDEFGLAELWCNDRDPQTLESMRRLFPEAVVH